MAMQRRLALAAAVLALLAAGCAAQVQMCGAWEGFCQPYGDDFITMRYEALGITDGAMMVTIGIFRDQSNCSDVETAALAIKYSPLYTDLGADTKIDGARNWELTPTSYQITARDEEAVNMLNQECPCGGTWSMDDERALTGCPADTCTNTTWLGGSVAPGNGVTIGSPWFGWIKLDDTTKVLTVSTFDSDFVAGFNQPETAVYTSVKQNRTCPPVENNSNYCGQWIQPCSPTMQPTSITPQPPSSYYSNFTYQGPSLDPYNAGLFVQTRHYFLDDNCKVPFYDVLEQGTFQQVNASQIVPGGFNVILFAPTVLVTPYSNPAVDELKHLCPCGDANLWKANNPRRLATCTEGSCHIHWNSFSGVGYPRYGNAYSVKDHMLEVELRFSHMQSNQSEGFASNISFTNFALEQMAGTCAYPNDASSALCGVWRLDCVASGSDTDYSTTLVFSGNTAVNGGEGTGTVDRYYTIYAPTTNCATNKVMISTVENGYWSDLGNSTEAVNPGAREIAVMFPSTVVTISDADMLTFMNSPDGCPCGGTWELDKPRTLASCPDGTCPNTTLLGSANLGRAGYGTIRIANDMLRISSLLTSADGLEEPLGISALPMPRIDVCPNPKYSHAYEAEWQQGCRSDSDTKSNYDFTSTAFFDPDGTYNISYYKYTPGAGCLTAPVLTVQHSGTWKINGDTNVVTSGSQLIITPSSIAVTPDNADIANMLNTQCKCNTNWVSGTTVTFKSGQVCTPCNAQDWMDMELAVKTQYGLMQRREMLLRISDTYQDQTTGWNTPFAPTNYDWVLIRDLEPHHGSSSSKKMSAGGVLLLIAFFGLLTYFVAGISMNYYNDKSLRIPHADFWTGLPGLISDGFKFTFVDCFGYRSTGPQYTRIEAHGGYGAL